MPRALRKKISQILVKWKIPTRQPAISEIVKLFEAEKKELIEKATKIIKMRLPDPMTEEEKEKYHCEGSILFWGEKLVEDIDKLKD